MELSASSLMQQPIAATSADLASVTRRVAARIIDGVVLYAVNLVAGLALGIVLVVLALLTGRPEDSLTEKLDGEGIAATVLSLLGYVLYFAICEGLHGATLGKRLLGIRVVAEDGGPCSLKAALVRSLGYLLDGIACFVPGIYFMMRSPLRQRIGDRAAHTVVEHTSANGAGQPSDWQFLAVLLAALFGEGVLVAIGVLWPLLF